jgi:hypothetical protein
LNARRREDKGTAVTPWPPLPREIEADPCAATLRHRLAANAVPLWRESATIVPVMPASHALAAVLAGAARDGTLVLGLEAAGAALDREELGLAARASREGGARVERISRVLLLASDGAERFYRAADRVTRRHAGRLLTCRLDLAAASLGRAALGRPAAVKAVLVQRKPAVVAVLRALADPGAPA